MLYMSHMMHQQWVKLLNNALYESYDALTRLMGTSQVTQWWIKLSHLMHLLSHLTYYNESFVCPCTETLWQFIESVDSVDESVRLRFGKYFKTIRCLFWHSCYLAFVWSSIIFACIHFMMNVQYENHAVSWSCSWTAPDRYVRNR